MCRFKNVTKSEIQSHLCNMRSKAGVDNVNVDVICDSFDVIGDLLTDIINETLNNGLLSFFLERNSCRSYQKSS